MYLTCEENAFRCRLEQKMRGHVDVTWGDHGGISPEVTGRNVFLWIFTLLRVIVFCSCSVFSAWKQDFAIDPIHSHWSCDRGLRGEMLFRFDSVDAACH